MKQLILDTLTKDKEFTIKAANLYVSIGPNGDGTYFVNFGDEDGADSYEFPDKESAVENFLEEYENYLSRKTYTGDH